MEKKTKKVDKLALLVEKLVAKKVLTKLEAEALLK